MTDDEREGDGDSRETADDPTEDLASMYDQSNAGAGQPDGTGSDGAAAGDDGPAVNLDAPVGAGESDPETATGTFYVKYATDTSVTLHEVNTGQIFTLIENPGLENHEIVEASLVAQPPMEVSYLVDELEDQYAVPVETSPEPPTRQVQNIADEMDEMEAAAIDREGDGEIHILRVASGDVERTAEELHEDEMTYKNAARYDAVNRVEIRTDDSGIVSVRYLP